MELENQGGMGTELNHWEKRLLEVSPDIRNGGGCGNVCFPAFMVSTGDLKTQVYQTSLK